MSATVRVKIDRCGRGSVFVDDFDISNCVSALAVRASVGKANEVTLTLIGTKLDIDLEGALIAMARPDATADEPDPIMQGDPGCVPHEHVWRPNGSCMYVGCDALRLCP